MKGRIAAEKLYRSLLPTPQKAKLAALRDWLIISLHTCQPPDRYCAVFELDASHCQVLPDVAHSCAHRVGVCRKLRLNQTLKRTGDGFTLDLTTARYKTRCDAPQNAHVHYWLPRRPSFACPRAHSRFYGPSITTVSTLLNEPLQLWLTQLEFSTCETEPYLFHPSDDASRCYTSSQWCSTVKQAFQRHTGKAPPPKLLRASFVRHRPSVLGALSRF